VPSSTVFNFLEACREPGCPLCRLEVQSVERYLDNQFYENVNSPRWREGLRASLGFCHEHAWLGVNKRLGDALGYSIIYRDVIDSLLKQLSNDASHRRVTLREKIDRILDAITPRKRCPVCEKRDETRRTLINVLVEEMKTPEVVEALRASSGFCLPHLRLTLEHIRDIADCEQIVNLQREKLESLSAELSEFIRKNDYQSIHEGFGKEGDAWLRAVSMIVGRRKDG
jgi:hypothetical protein